MAGDISMRKPSVRKVILEAHPLALAGYGPGPYDRGGNPQGLSQRDVERDYMNCEYKARLANENQFYDQRTPFPFGPGPLSPNDHARALHGISSINAMRDTCLATIGYPSNRRMVKKASCFVLASFRSSTYYRRSSENGIAVGAFPFAKIHSRGERPTRSAVCISSALHSLRPCRKTV